MSAEARNVARQVRDFLRAEEHWHTAWHAALERHLEHLLATVRVVTFTCLEHGKDPADCAYEDHDHTRIRVTWDDSGETHYEGPAFAEDDERWCMPTARSLEDWASHLVDADHACPTLPKRGCAP